MNWVVYTVLVKLAEAMLGIERRPSKQALDHEIATSISFVVEVYVLFPFHMQPCQMLESADDAMT